MNFPSWDKKWTRLVALVLLVAWVVAAFFMKSTVSGDIDLVLFLAFAAAAAIYFVQSWRSN